MPPAKTVSFQDPYSQDYTDLARQKAMADMLSQQANEPLKTDRTAGGYVIPIGKGEVFGKLAQSALAAYLGNKTNKSETDLNNKVAEGDKNDLAGIVGALQGTPAKSEPFQADTFDAEDQPFGAMSTETAAVPGDKNKAMSLALGSRNPAYQGIGATLMADMLKGQDPYSLSPGQVRYDANNQQIASVPKESGQTEQFGKVMPRDYTPESLSKYKQSGNFADLKPVSGGIKFGNINPGQFTPESLDIYTQTGDIGDLVPFRAPTQIDAGGYKILRDQGTGKETRYGVTVDPAQGAAIVDRRREMDYDLPQKQKSKAPVGRIKWDK